MPNYKYPNKRARKKATARLNNAYKKTHQTLFSFRFHNINDKAVIDKLNEVNNRTNYIRNLVKSDIAKTTK